MTQLSRNAAWLSAIAISVAVLAAYAPGLRTPFQYDDVDTVVGNESIRQLSAIGTVLSPPPDRSPTSGRPLLNLSFAIDYAAFGLNVTGYHATNIALHLVCVLLVFAVVRATCRWPTAGLDPYADGLAAATAAIWAVHPLQTGTVTYISGRSESLMAVCYLAALFAAIRAHRSPHAPAWSVASIVACGVGMACKESMATAPIAILLYDRAYVYSDFAAAVRDRWRFYAGLGCTWLIVAALLSQSPHSESTGFSAGVSAWTYVLNQAVVIPEYVRLAAWPDHLLFAFGEVRPMTLGDVGVTGIIMPALIAGAVWLWYRRPALGFPAIWVFLTLAPTSSIVPIVTEAGAARRMYLPLAGIVVLVVGIGLMAARRPRGFGRTAALWTAATVSSIVVLLAAITAAQSRQFASTEQLWRGSQAHWPSALAHRNLAAELLRQGRRAEAVEALRAASDLKPVARYSLGVQLFEQGRPSEAIVELRRAIQESPNDRTIALEGRRVLARALREQGRHLEAAQVFDEVAALTPDDIAPALSRADALLAAGDLAAAHQAYQRVLAAHPEHLGAMTNSGLVLLRLGRVTEALPLLRTAAERQPDNVDAYMNLASASAAAGLLPAAAAAACHAMAIDPQNPLPGQLLDDLRSTAASAGVRLPGCGVR